MTIPARHTPSSRPGVLLLLIAALIPARAGAQPSAGRAGEEPHAMARAAGMPLHDGALPPGMLTVRVVRGGFSENLAGQPVEVRVLGGKIERAATGADGRVQVAHLPVSGQVQAVALVGGERLESEVFTMPAESGVRILLVAGSGATAEGGPADGGFTHPPTAASAGPIVEPRTEAGPDWRRRIAAGLMAAFAIALAVMLLGPRARRMRDQFKRNA
jgi:hypothetical protein